MKFKDKDGNVFEDIEAARWAFCGQEPRFCPQCKLFNGKWIRCHEWCDSHPAEAARLMGYEVVEEEPTCDTCMHNPPSSFGGKPCSVCGPNEPALNSYQKKETNMNKLKPHICQVLGVEAGEKFGIGHETGENWFFISEAGLPVRVSGHDKIGECLALAVNRPESIIRQSRAEEKEEPMKQDKLCRLCKDEICVNADSPMRADYCPVPDTPGVCRHEDRTPRFTEEEVARAENLFDVTDEDGIICKNEQGDTFLLTEGKQIQIRKDVFPSVCPDSAVRLSEIVGGSS